MSYLQSEKVVLRTLAQSDLLDCACWASDPEVTKYMYLGTFPVSREAMRREYENMASALPGNLTQQGGFPSNVMFIILDASSSKSIGWCGLFGINWITRVAELRAIIGEKSCWGGGYALDAYRLALGYGFDRLNLRKITGGQRADNYAAIKAARKVGFVQEGCLRNHFLRKGVAYDIIVNGVMREEFYTLFPFMAPRLPEPPRKDSDV